jgi:secondary thiamine-phosphate synthase enzyme
MEHHGVRRARETRAQPGHGADLEIEAELPQRRAENEQPRRIGFAGDDSDGLDGADPRGAAGERSRTSTDAAYETAALPLSYPGGGVRLYARPLDGIKAGFRYHGPMPVKTDTIRLKSRGRTDVIDVTRDVQASVAKSGLRSGIATVFVSGSTAGLTTIEFEPGLVKDIADALERVAPRDADYAHHERWGDDNGHSHIRASLIGPSLTVPFSDGRLALGTWQQIVLLDFDTRPRDRELTVQILGE